MRLHLDSEQPGYAAVVHTNQPVELVVVPHLTDLIDPGDLSAGQATEWVPDGRQTRFFYLSPFLNRFHRLLKTDDLMKFVKQWVRIFDARISLWR